MESATNKKIRLAYISSINARWVHLEWVADELDRERFEPSFVLVSIAEHPPHLETFLQERGFPYHRIDCKLQPFSIARTVFEIARYCRREKIEIVHCHIFFASLVGLLGALLARVPVRVTTRHHATMNHGTSFYWLDRLTNWMATHVVASCDLVRKILIDDERTPERKVELIHLGLDLAGFTHPETERVDRLMGKYSTDEHSPVIGVVARHIELKGIQYIVPAFERLLDKYPSSYLMLFYASGPYRETIEGLLESIPEERYIMVEFEPDLFALYHLFDLYVHVPIGPDQESFGLTFIEALAAGVPSIFTRSGVGPEFLIHRENAWLVDYESSDQIYQGMLALLGDEELREELVKSGIESVRRFDYRRMVRELENFYLRNVRRRVPQDVLSRS
ncbi:MAG: glycosyltransferase family 4 protein [Acidobacteriota bacterium]